MALVFLFQMKQWLVVLLVTLALTAMLVESEESEEFSALHKRATCTPTHRDFWRRDCWGRHKRAALADDDDDVLFDVSIRGHST